MRTRAGGRWPERTPALGHAAMIAGYMGSGRTFDEAICDFAGDYADQAERDHEAFVKAIRERRVTAAAES